MATATVRDGINQVKTLKLAHTAAVSAGDVIVNNGQVLVAVNDASASADNAYIYRGKIEVPKEANLAIAVGDVVYWDATNEVANKTNTNTKMGICVEASAASDTTVVVMLGENK